MKSNPEKTERFQGPPEFAVTFANIVFVSGMVYFGLLTVYALQRILKPPEPVSSAFYFLCILFGGISATSFGLGLRSLSNGLKVNLSVLFFTVGISVYAFESYLEFSRSRENRARMEIIQDLSDSGVKAYPNHMPTLLRESNGLKTNNGRIYPLGGIANSTTILGNESGYYPIIETDEHGFHNPKGLYKEYRIDIMLTGDSFAEGYSVHSNETISAVLRESGFSAISLGKGGNGSLIELAALKEYAQPLKPKTVLWLYHVNDLHDLKYEMNSPILRQYLNKDDFSQNLISRQFEINRVLIDYVQGRWEKEREREKRKIDILTLPNLRARTKLKPQPASLAPLSERGISVFKNVLVKAKRMVSVWDGRMYFVYLPSLKRYSTGKEDEHRKDVLRAATELNISIIDIHSEVFASHADPLSLFPFRSQGHYTPEGYRLVAEEIGARLKTDGVVPSDAGN